METLSERVVFARELVRLTQSQLAREVNVSPSAIHQIEKGHTKSLKAPTAIAIERRTGVSAEWLMSGRGPAMRRDRETPSKTAQVNRIMEALENLPESHRDKIESEIRFLASLPAPKE